VVYTLGRKLHGGRTGGLTPRGDGCCSWGLQLEASTSLSSNGPMGGLREREFVCARRTSPAVRRGKWARWSPHVIVEKDSNDNDLLVSQHPQKVREVYRMCVHSCWKKLANYPGQHENYS
jgi:hypothetical protein